MSKQFHLTWLMLASAVALTACGGGGSTAAEPTPTPTPTPGPPTMSDRIAAANATVAHNPLCSAGTLGSYYWQIGDQNGMLAEGQSGAGVSANSNMLIASASKWVYGAYVVQKKSGVLDANNDVPFLNFTSGYTKMGNVSAGLSLTCSGTVQQCLTSNGGDVQDPTTIGAFDYDSGHMQEHATAKMGLGSFTPASLSSEVNRTLGTSFSYNLALLAGGISASANDYAQFLRSILNGTLAMRNALGTNAVCTNPHTCSHAVYSPVDEASNESWHYSMGHWVEDDPGVNGDGAFSSAGAFGFYPWIDASKTYYGVFARYDPIPNTQQGYETAKCGRLVRHAFLTATEQTGTVPAPAN